MPVTEEEVRRFRKAYRALDSSDPNTRFGAWFVLRDLEFEFGPAKSLAIRQRLGR